MTTAIYMNIKLYQDLMMTNISVKFGEDWTITCQEQAWTKSTGRTDGWMSGQTDGQVYGWTFRTTVSYRGAFLYL